MNFKKWVKSIQAAAYNGARTVVKQGLVNIQVGGPMNYMNRDLTSTWL